MAKIDYRDWNGAAVPLKVTGSGTVADPYVLSVSLDATASGSVTPAANTANPTAPPSVVFPMVYDGATWDPLPGDSANGTYVAGSVAHDTADTGGPVKMGGKAVTAEPTAVTNNDRVNAYFDEYGRQHTIVDGNKSVTCYASAARTATPTAMADQNNYNARGLHVTIDVTAVTADPSVVFTIQGKDALSGKYYTILASAAIVGTGTTVLKVYPGITAAANVSVSDILPAVWRVIATHGDADSITYSVGASLVI